jgi:hypothetical protein
MAFHQLVHELGETAIRFGAVSLHPTVMRAEQAQYLAVIFADFDKRIRSEQNLHSLVAGFAIPLDNDCSDFCHQ